MKKVTRTFTFMSEQSELTTKQAGRAKETLFRVSYQHQSKLIQIADYKANMIISLSTMIISALIAIIGYGAVSGNGIEFNSKFFIPVVGIVLFSLVALIFAIQAARPKLLMTRNSEAQAQKSSLLFFGVIARHSQQDYLAKMKTLMGSDTEMYEQMTIDLHNQGIILKRKYNLLVYAYQVLKYGFLINVLLFFIILLIDIKS